MFLVDAEVVAWYGEQAVHFAVSNLSTRARKVGFFVFCFLVFFGTFIVDAEVLLFPLGNSYSKVFVLILGV
jgi:hypothetical protein